MGKEKNFLVVKIVSKNWTTKKKWSWGWKNDAVKQIFFKITPSAKLDANLILEKNAEKGNKTANVPESYFLEEMSTAEESIEGLLQ